MLRRSFKTLIYHAHNANFLLISKPYACTELKWAIFQVHLQFVAETVRQKLLSIHALDLLDYWDNVTFSAFQLNTEPSDWIWNCLLGKYRKKIQKYRDQLDPISLTRSPETISLPLQKDKVCRLGKEESLKRPSLFDGDAQKSVNSFGLSMQIFPHHRLF